MAGPFQVLNQAWLTSVQRREKHAPCGYRIVWTENRVSCYFRLTQLV